MTQKLKLLEGASCGYITASKRVRAIGALLPSNSLIGKELNNVSKWHQKEHLFPTWACEIIAHPAKYSTFAKGQDIVDTETRWTVTWNDIVKLVGSNEILGSRKGLFIVPTEIIVEKSRKIVIPQTIVVVKPFLNNESQCGRIQQKTGIARDIETNSINGIGFLYIKEHMGVRPIVRGMDEMDGKIVFAMANPRMRCKVTYVEKQSK